MFTVTYYGVTFHQQLALAKLHGAAVAVGYGFALPTQGAQLGLELIGGGIDGHFGAVHFLGRSGGSQTEYGNGQQNGQENFFHDKKKFKKRDE